MSTSDTTGTIAGALTFVHSYAGHVDDWLTVKKELLRALPPDLRALFSTRDPVTKRQRTNDFERQLVERWSEMTGRPVVLKGDV